MSVSLESGSSPRPDNDAYAPELLADLADLERRLLWLSSWTIHHANHLRPSRDGLKVGGHQSSCASLVSLMTALYFHVLGPRDRVAVKPHAGPVYHAIEYLFGRQSRAQLEGFRSFGGIQAYPSRTKDAVAVDFSTGSVGLGAALTLFASLTRDYLRGHDLGPAPGAAAGRMVALIGDAELDEGNMFEAVLEGAKHDVRNLWWIIDYNRQSLDGVVADERLFRRFDDLFETMGWEVVTLKFGKRLAAAGERAGGDALLNWIETCPNALYSALTFKGGAAWREHIARDLAGVSGVAALLDEHDDDALAGLMTNLGGHDMETILDAFDGVCSDAPHCFIAYTIKGYGLPFAGHKDNHSGLMNPAQMATFQAAHGIGEGAEWEPFAGLGEREERIRRFVAAAPRAAGPAVVPAAPAVAVPEPFPAPAAAEAATQDAFGRILSELARADSALARRIVTASPDVTVSTNLGPWVNRVGLYGRTEQTDVFRDEQVASPQMWRASPAGRHVELGIAENNLFLLLAAFGLAPALFGTRLLPIGTLYDPFIERGLDALNYACYTDARFLVVATPAGITLAPEGGAHQSIATPLIGMAQCGLSAYEPAFIDELAVMMRWAFGHMQADDGGSVYLRLSTRKLEQPGRDMTPALAAQVIEGGYWLVPPAAGAELAVAFAGALAPEAIEAHRQIAEDVPGCGLLAVTSADRLHAGWTEAQHRREGGDAGAASHAEALLDPLAPDAGLITVLDGHPATLSWLGSVRGRRIRALGVERFGQSGDIPDLYRHYGLDSAAILDAAAQLLLSRRPAC